MDENRLVMSFEPSTIEHLGVKMYSTLPPALAEMIANSYDACAQKVFVKLYDIDPQNKYIVIRDDGNGMSFDEVNDFYLRIGRNRRKEGHKQTNCERVATGKKGLGKLALFGLGEVITISTTQNKRNTTFELKWNDILNCKGDYLPEFHLEETDAENGTVIQLSGLKRKTGFDIDALAHSLAMLFNFSAADFHLEISLNEGEAIKIDSKLKYKNVDPEFYWKYEEILPEIREDYGYKNLITGEVLTTEKPIKPGLRGITLFANGRMVNAPEFFGQSESSYFYSYATGWLNVDFVDNWDEDLISTNRQSIDWENEKTIELRQFLRSIMTTLERIWRDQRKTKRREKITEKTEVNVEKWYETLPSQVQAAVEKIVNAVDDSELSQDAQAETIQSIHSLIPEYPNFHWRNIHPEIKKVSERHYQNNDYYTAFQEALKRYIAAVKKKAGAANVDERKIIQEVFGGKKLTVTKRYKKMDGSEFSAKTIENIENGQFMLSEGIVVGGRHPVAHEEHIELNVTGLFSEKDCLDFLSMLSHLFKRLDDAETL